MSRLLLIYFLKTWQYVNIATFIDFVFLMRKTCSPEVVGETKDVKKADVQLYIRTK